MPIFASINLLQVEGAKSSIKFVPTTGPTAVSYFFQEDKSLRLVNEDFLFLSPSGLYFTRFLEEDYNQLITQEKIYLTKEEVQTSTKFIQFESEDSVDFKLQLNDKISSKSKLITEPNTLEITEDIRISDGTGSNSNLIQEKDIEITNNVFIKDSINADTVLFQEDDLDLDIDLEIVDLTGPLLFNLIPGSGETFIDPETNVSFDIIDLEGSTIDISSINIYVSGVQVVTTGTAQVIPGFGGAVLGQVTDSYYEFLFIPENNFGAGQTIPVSGTVRDSVTPLSNLTSFQYNFRTWFENDLIGIINPLPDVTAPFLTNENPAPFQIEVPVVSNILFDIEDLHTGVDLNSIIIYVDGTLIQSGVTNLEPLLYSTNISGSSTGKGYSVDIDPVNNFAFSDIIEIRVVTSDLFTISGAPNIADITYSFNTVDNTHLIIDNFSILEGTTYVPITEENSYLTNTSGSTSFYIDFTDLDEVGIHTSGSYISNNGTIIPTTFSAISGNYSYRVFFELTPDYTTDADLIFHVEQDFIVDTPVFKDFFSELLWGYEMCYEPTTNNLFQSNSTVSVITRACDTAYLPTQNSYVAEYTTTPSIQVPLIGQITAVPISTADLMASYISNNPFFEYGKTMNLNLSIKDFAGNELDFSWSFKIEEEV